jgi:hypothetical protein
MSERTPLSEIDEAQAALIDQRLAQFGSFMQNVLRHPEIAEAIPTGSTLAFHDVQGLVEQTPLRLTAYRPPGATRWSVLLADAPRVSKGLSTVPPQGFLWVVQPLVQHATWASAEEAFTAVDEALQRATELQLLAG